MSLDTKGIWLDEIKNKYPPSFQTLGYDVSFDSDSMYKPKVLSTFELGVNTILTLLFMKPGQFPSIPDLGIDIESYLFKYSDDPRNLVEIKDKLDDQCNRIGVSGFDINVIFSKMQDGNDAILVIISATETVAYNADGYKVIIGITYDKLKRLYIRKDYVK